MIVLLAAATAFLLTVFLIWHRHSRCKDLLEAQLRRHHFTGIKASIAWGSLEMHAYTYNVRYFDRRGRRHRNRATVHVRAEHGDMVHWRHQLERPRSKHKPLGDALGHDDGLTLERWLPLITDARDRHATQ
jgi:hypothetical protein